jgi:hypothetical protein
VIPTETPEEFYERYQRRLCPECRHSYTWHDPAHYDIPAGCGVRGCYCERLDPEDGRR